MRHTCAAKLRHKKSNRLHQNCHQKGWRPASLITTQQHRMQQLMPTASIPARLYKHQPPGNQAGVPISADQAIPARAQQHAGSLVSNSTNCSCPTAQHTVLKTHIENQPRKRIDNPQGAVLYPQQSSLSHGCSPCLQLLPNQPRGMLVTGFQPLTGSHSAAKPFAVQATQSWPACSRRQNRCKAPVNTFSPYKLHR